MAKNTVAAIAKTNKPEAQRAVSKQLAAKGLHTSHEFANITGALFTDVVLGLISPDVCNAACNAAGKLLAVVALQHKYGTRAANGTKSLRLTD
jgi:hypothetical protein